MRVLLKIKGQYYRGANQEGGLSDEPVEFASVAAATRFALQERLPDVEIALRCDYVDREVGMPVLREWCELDERQRLRSESERGEGTGGAVEAEIKAA